MDALLYIEKGLPYQYRRSSGRLLFIGSTIFLVLAVNSLVFRLPQIYFTTFEVLFLLFLALYIANGLIKIIFLHIYKNRLQKGYGQSYEMLVVSDLGRTSKDGVTGFINSSYGDEIMKRLGIRRESLENYINKRNISFCIPEEDLQNDGIDLQAYALILHDSDDHFASYLREQRTNRDDLLHAARLVQNISILQKENDMVWSNAALHQLSPFEQDALNIEKAHNVYFTSPVLRRLSVLDDDEKFRILKQIISGPKKEKRNEIGISDLMSL